MSFAGGGLQRVQATACEVQAPLRVVGTCSARCRKAPRLHDCATVKVALLNSYFAPEVIGGAEVVTADIARGLRERGHDVIVLALTSGPARCEQVDGVRVHRVPLANVFWPPSRAQGHLAVTGLFHAIDRYHPLMGARAGAILDRERPAILHTHNLLGWSTAVWRAAQVRGLPIVHSLHDQRLLCHRGSGMDRAGILCQRRCIECRLVGIGKLADTRLPTEVVGVSRWILDHHLAAGAFTGVRTGVIHNAAAPAAARSIAPSARLRVGFLGRLLPEKGPLDLVAAVAALASGGAPIEVVIAGDGPSRAALEHHRGAPLTLLGTVARDRLFDAVDVLVVPSRWNEPFGLVAIEALARGVPVLASRRGGLPEIIEDGVTGWLYDPDDPNGLIEALSRVLADRPRLGDFASRGLRYARRFAPEYQIAAYVDVYERAVSARPTPPRGHLAMV